MTLRAEDLPPAARARLLEQAGRTGRRPAPPAKLERGAGPSYTCNGCGEHFDHYGKAAEDHALKPGHSRLNMNLDTV